MDFNVSIYENRKAKGSPLLVAHRGVCGANVPCNSIAAYKIALNQGADVVEIDVSKSKDGKFYVFHPGMERAHLGVPMLLSALPSKIIDKLHFLNQTLYCYTWHSFHPFIIIILILAYSP